MSTEQTVAPTTEPKTSVTYIDVDGSTKTITDFELLSESCLKGEWFSKFYVIGKDYNGDNKIDAEDAKAVDPQYTTIKIDNGIVVKGQAELILVDGFTLEVQGDNECAGIAVIPGGDTVSLTIYGQENCTGTLISTGGNGGAGIGGNKEYSNSSITINGGNITAKGGSKGAGIGGGESCQGQFIYINGGNVTAIATGSNDVSGIGGGNAGGASNIFIKKNLTVKAGNDEESQETVKNEGGDISLALDTMPYVTVETPTFSVSVDSTLKDKWFKQGDTVTLFGTYVSETTPTITIGDEATATIVESNKTWSYTYTEMPGDTKGTELTITIATETQSADTKYTLLVDTVAPVVSTVMLDGKVYNQEWIKLDPKDTTASITLVEETSGIAAEKLSIIIDGRPMASQQEYSFDKTTNTITLNKGTLSTGNHTVQVMGQDVAGNTFSTNVYFRCDADAPTISSVSLTDDYFNPNENKHWFKQNSPNAVLTASIIDDESGIQTTSFNSFNGVEGKDNTYTFTFDTSKNASYSGIKVTATDKVENTGYCIDTDAINYAIDCDAPTIDIKYDEAEGTVKAEVTDGEGSGVQINGTSYSYDGETWHEYTGDSFTPSSYHISFKSVDNVGNESIETCDITNVTIKGEKTVEESSPLDVETLTMAEESKLTVNQNASVTADELVMKGKDTIDNQGGMVNVQTLSVNGTDNELCNDLMSMRNISMADGAELGLNKNQYDAFMSGTNFLTKDGKLTVSNSTGNAMRTADIDILMNKENLSNVEFEQDLIELNKLDFKATKAVTIGFVDAYGTTKNDTIRFYKNTYVVLGSKGQEINLQEGNNNIQVDQKAITNIVSNVANISTITSAARSTVTMADITFQAGRNATLKVESASFDAGAINGSDKTTTIAIGKNTRFSSGNMTLGNKNDAITANQGANVAIGSVRYNEADTICQFTGSSLEFNGGNDQLNAKCAIFATGSLDFGAGNDKLTTAQDTRFIAALSWTGNWETPTSESELISANIVFGEGNDTLSVGKSSHLIAGNIIDAETITLGAQSKSTLGDIKGTKKLTTSNGYERNGQTTLLTAAAVTGTSANDSFKFGNYNVVSLNSIDLGEGNDTLAIGQNTKFTCTGTVSGIETLNLAACSKTQVGNISGTKKLTISNSKARSNGASLTAAAVTGTSGNDTFNFGNYNTVNIKGLLDFDGGKDTITAGKGATVTLKSADTSGLNKFTLGKDSVAYLSSEMLDAFETLNKAGTAEKNNLKLYDIGAAEDVAIHFTSIEQEQNDNTYNGAQKLTSTEYTGWLCGEDNLDLNDFFRWGTSTSVTNVGDIEGLTITQYKDKTQIGDTVEFKGTINLATTATCYSIGLADTEHEAMIYKIQIAEFPRLKSILTLTPDA